MAGTYFRRGFIHRKTEPARLGIELGDGSLYTLPNPTPEGRSYDAQRLLERVGKEGRVDLSRWERLEP